MNPKAQYVIVVEYALSSPFFLSLFLQMLCPSFCKYSSEICFR